MINRSSCYSKFDFVWLALKHVVPWGLRVYIFLVLFVWMPFQGKPVGAHADKETKQKNIFEYLLLSFQTMAIFRMTVVWNQAVYRYLLFALVSVALCHCQTHNNSLFEAKMARQLFNVANIKYFFWVIVVTQSDFWIDLDNLFSHRIEYLVSFSLLDAW